MKSFTAEHVMTNLFQLPDRFRLVVHHLGLYLHHISLPLRQPEALWMWAGMGTEATGVNANCLRKFLKKNLQSIQFLKFVHSKNTLYTAKMILVAEHMSLRRIRTFYGVRD